MRVWLMDVCPFFCIYDFRLKGRLTSDFRGFVNTLTIKKIMCKCWVKTMYLQNVSHRCIYQSSYFEVKNNKLFFFVFNKMTRVCPSFQHVNCVNKTFLKSSAIENDLLHPTVCLLYNVSFVCMCVLKTWKNCILKILCLLIKSTICMFIEKKKIILWN